MRASTGYPRRAVHSGRFRLTTTNAEYVPYHICSSRTVLHKIYHDRARPSHLLLPVIPG
jgi:hypothetical protein